MGVDFSECQTFRDCCLSIGEIDVQQNARYDIQKSLTERAAKVQMKSKSMFLPLGCRVRQANIRWPSARHLSMVLRNPARITDTMSFVVCPGEQKCSATGKVRFLCDGTQMFTEPVPEPA